MCRCSCSEGQSSSRVPIRVLVVDDHWILRCSLRFMLQAEPDLEVVGEAARGEEAVVLAELIRPDVVLMDVSLPGLSGIEATRQIHRQQPQVRIVGYSSYTEPEVRQAMLRAGAVAYVPKGGRIEHLLIALQGRTLCS